MPEARAKRFDILTVFPRIFDSYLDESLLARAIKKKLIVVATHNLRDYLLNRKERVDDRPFGGGPGMVLKLEPIYRAVEDVKRRAARGKQGTKRAKKTRVILFSTRGRVLNAAHARRLAKYDRLILVCGHYEGVDERVARRIADEEISIGNFVLSGGELAALVTIETVSRFINGFLGKMESLEEIKGSYPVYTRPAVFAHKKGARWAVPKVLMSGDHKKIAAWRKRT